MNDWRIYQASAGPHRGIERLPAPPSWRTYDATRLQPQPRDEQSGWTHADSIRGKNYRPGEDLLDEVNAALYLRRPLLVTGTPGVGKSGLAYSVAWQLRLGPVLRWPITSSSTLKDGLYSYDAISRLQDVNLNRDRPAGSDAGKSESQAEIGRYLRLGPLGTALLPADTPRVLLIDEIDKASLDLPNDLLNVFEEGEYEIQELVRLAAVESEVRVTTADGTKTELIRKGLVRCRQFPFVVMTSNGERDFPAAFQRRCVPLKIGAPKHDQLAEIVRAHLGLEISEKADDLISRFEARAREGGDLANDQLLNAIHLLKAVQATRDLTSSEQDKLVKILFTHLNESD
jgi:MoxR-like ATPase